MKIALISDIHANFDALTAVYNDIRADGISQIYCLGDLVGYYTQIEEVINFVADRNIISIKGNFDKAATSKSEAEGLLYLKKGLSDERKKMYHWTRTHLSKPVKDFIAGLPNKIKLEFDHMKMLLVHGSPASVSNYLYPETPRLQFDKMLSDLAIEILACGHTHIPMVVGTKEGTVINPGSVGFPKDGSSGASYMVISLAGTPVFSVKNVAYDDANVKNLAREKIYATSC